MIGLADGTFEIVDLHLVTSLKSRVNGSSEPAALVRIKRPRPDKRCLRPV